MTLRRTIAKLWCHKLFAVFWTTLYYMDAMAMRRKR